MKQTTPKLTETNSFTEFEKELRESILHYCCEKDGNIKTDLSLNHSDLTSHLSIFIKDRQEILVLIRLNKKAITFKELAHYNIRTTQILEELLG